MKCPYCSKEMLEGYFNNGRQPIQWIPKGKNPSAFAFSISADGIRLRNTYSIMKGYSAEAYYCNTCRTVISKTE